MTLAIFCHRKHHPAMSSMNISLPETLKSFIDDQVADGAYGTTSEYVRDLVRQDRDLKLLRGMILEGAGSPLEQLVDAAYFDALRARARGETR